MLTRNERRRIGARIAWLAPAVLSAVLDIVDEHLAARPSGGEAAEPASLRILDLEMESEALRQEIHGLREDLRGLLTKYQPRGQG
jgi:hypothetical protein